ncbi:DUF1217 domain-containing protein [Mesorhizobium microcysteis]|uniref:DUF1217 domain-containing protein n=1 Tax=Neoaquamicrobium microcysteis TaxID=2682781 RepID=A0A5D4GMR4_9HYPH|nr:DUF1217 domain-containing protein [Mesorhizobium microcysteis]TYR30116.1 DUF1217 domain-containing protein [Mesorhizobium microcysteis]
MINTYMSYNLITRDLGKSLDRVEKQPVVQRDTEYYLANITKVKTIDEFVNNPRLFNYAMKAHGLEDMTYAKAFMVKALKEGVTDPDSFANKLIDKRYAEFVKSFNFAAYGEFATTYAAAEHPVIDLYLKVNTPPNGAPSQFHIQESAYYAQNIGNVKSIDDFLHKDNERLLTYALNAIGLDDAIDDPKLIRKMLEGGIDDPKSPANVDENEKWAAFAKTFDFAGLGEAATTYNLSQRPAVDKYLRQALEEDAGAQNEGVRLALYFSRKAGEITNAYQILGDKALGTVVRTLLGLPDAVAQLDIDKQAALIESKINLEDFQDPEKLGKLMQRFTTMWEMNNPTTSPESMLVSLFQPMEFGISMDTMMAIAKMQR